MAAAFYLLLETATLNYVATSTILELKDNNFRPTPKTVRPCKLSSPELGVGPYTDGSMN